jgi:hypothetical protein
MACLRIHGMPVRYHHKYMGWNARLDALQPRLNAFCVVDRDGAAAGQSDGAVGGGCGVAEAGAGDEGRDLTQMAVDTPEYDG